MHYVAPLIAEAWEQHRRRRARLLTAAVAAAAIAALIWLASGGLRTPGGDSGQASGGSVAVQASTVLSGLPFMGIHVCHPSSSTCYRVGLAVWLKRPALSVTAAIAGEHSALSRSDRRGIRLISYGRHEFIGFFRPTGIVPHAYLRTPDATPQVPTALVSLTIERGRGQPLLVTPVRVPVEAGWG
ncbi:MAG: hypothetical protein KGL15_02650 [Acidobacteriota bacterium]|nr:hypothetical protein [Acidobacteriota bacterium]